MVSVLELGSLSGITGVTSTITGVTLALLVSGLLPFGDVLFRRFPTWLQWWKGRVRGMVINRRQMIQIQRVERTACNAMVMGWFGSWRVRK